ncbi:hypothetical protein PoB_005019100 [Plakobranchus ocellatus]|uniref:Transmembrane protein n=1 Tax=Plakobranchus ocellatus TaxID=259542 RepID=A0AAV4BX57_9GAST|nr:hypothetical protein PoB_005019100 [Plakobranchus ocellatus]
MAELGQGEPALHYSETGNVVCTVGLRSALEDDTTPENYTERKPENYIQKDDSLTTIRPAKPFIFYFGVFLTLIGVAAFFVGSISSKWVVVHGGPSEDGDYQSDIRRRMLAHLGPWRACDQGGSCGPVYDVAPGIRPWSVRGMQTLLVLSILGYLAGAVVLIIQMLGTRLTTVHCKRLLTDALPECFILVAAVLAFMSALTMGQLKRELIFHQGQSTLPGWGLIVSVMAVAATVIGAICIALFRHLDAAETKSLVEQSILAPLRCITRGAGILKRRGRVRMRKMRRTKFRRTRRRFSSLSVSDFRVSVIGSSDLGARRESAVTEPSRHVGEGDWSFNNARTAAGGQALMNDVDSGEIDGRKYFQGKPSLNQKEKCNEDKNIGVTRSGRGENIGSVTDQGNIEYRDSNLSKERSLSFGNETKGSVKDAHQGRSAYECSGRPGEARLLSRETTHTQKQASGSQSKAVDQTEFRSRPMIDLRPTDIGATSAIFSASSELKSLPNTVDGHDVDQMTSNKGQPVLITVQAVMNEKDSGGECSFGEVTV